MVRAPGFNQRALGIRKREIAGVTPERIPHLRDEAESLADCEVRDVDCWIDHERNLSLTSRENNLLTGRRRGDV